MTNEQAAMKLSMHLMQCGALMPIKWVEGNGAGSDTSEAFRLAIDSLRTNQSDHIADTNKTGGNPPLTLEELSKMNREPVWIEPMWQWRTVHLDCEGEFVGLHTDFDIISAKGVLKNGGRIYRRKPEEVAQ